MEVVTDVSAAIELGSKLETGSALPPRLAQPASPSPGGLARRYRGHEAAAAEAEGTQARVPAGSRAPPRG